MSVWAKKDTGQSHNKLTINAKRSTVGPVVAPCFLRQGPAMDDEGESNVRKGFCMQRARSLVTSIPPTPQSSDKLLQQRFGSVRPSASPAVSPLPWPWQPQQSSSLHPNLDCGLEPKLRAAPRLLSLPPSPTTTGLREYLTRVDPIRSVGNSGPHSR